MSVTLDMAKLEKMIAELNPAVRDAVGETAFAVEGQAKMLAPVDTGFLRSSIQADDVSGITWRVNVWAEYGPFVELGTSRMRAQPFLAPAVEALRAFFHRKLAEAMNK